jgi:hypothetical protein
MDKTSAAPEAPKPAVARYLPMLEPSDDSALNPGMLMSHRLSLSGLTVMAMCLIRSLSQTNKKRSTPVSWSPERSSHQCAALRQIAKNWLCVPKIRFGVDAGNGRGNLPAR